MGRKLNVKFSWTRIINRLLFSHPKSKVRQSEHQILKWVTLVWFGDNLDLWPGPWSHVMEWYDVIFPSSYISLSDMIAFIRLGSCAWWKYKLAQKRIRYKLVENQTKTSNFRNKSVSFEIRINKNYLNKKHTIFTFQNHFNNNPFFKWMN